MQVSVHEKSSTEDNEIIRREAIAQTKLCIASSWKMLDFRLLFHNSLNNLLIAIYNGKIIYAFSQAICSGNL